MSHPDDCLPDCMMPDGGEACAGYQHARAEIAAWKRQRDVLAAAVEERSAEIARLTEQRDRAMKRAGIPYLDEAIARLIEKDHASAFALADIAVERVRQIEKEGWTTGHDDAHPSGELSTAGAAYALSWHTPRGSINPPPAFWPWHLDWWKPKSKHRNCVRAGALIVAELARHLRSGPAALDAEAAAEPARQISDAERRWRERLARDLANPDRLDREPDAESSPSLPEAPEPT